MYQLLDGGSDPDDPEHHWGLVRHDNTPKPAFHAIPALLGAFNESGNASRPVANSIRMTLRQVPPEARILQFQEADGSTLLAIWRAARCWNVAAAADIAVKPLPLTVALDRAVGSAAFMVPNDGPEWTPLPVSADGFVIAAGAKVVLVRLTGVPA